MHCYVGKMNVLVYWMQPKHETFDEHHISPLMRHCYAYLLTLLYSQMLEDVWPDNKNSTAPLGSDMK